MVTETSAAQEGIMKNLKWLALAFSARAGTGRLGLVLGRHPQAANAAADINVQFSFGHQGQPPPAPANQVNK